MGQGTSGSLGGRTIGKLDEAVCNPHRTRGGDEKHRFGGLGLKTTAWVSQFGLKTCGSDLVIWASKSLQRFLGLGLKTKQRAERRFVGLHLKTDGQMKTVWRHASASDSLLRSEASCIRVSQFVLKTGGSAAADGTHGNITEVSLRRRKRQTVR